MWLPGEEKKAYLARCLHPGFNIVASCKSVRQDARTKKTNGLLSEVASPDLLFKTVTADGLGSCVRCKERRY